jgi:site-specific recombinase XerD
VDSNIRTFIDELIIAKQTEAKSPATVAWYRARLTRFADWLGPDAKLRDLTLERARAFVAMLQTSGTRYQNHPNKAPAQGSFSPHYIHGYVRSLKMFSHWLLEEGYLPVDVLARLKRPSLPKTVVDTLSDEEIRRILAAHKPNCFTGARNLAIYMLLIDTGIRASELITLRLSNVDLQKSHIKVVGKGNKERVVSIVNGTRSALSSYIHYWRPECDHDFVFTTFHGPPYTYGPMVHSMKRLGQKLGIPRLHPHLFRHSFAVGWLMNGGDEISLQKTLGHTDLAMTSKYVTFTGMQMQARHDQFSPAAKYNLKALRAKV